MKNIKVRILKETTNYAYKIATMIMAGKENWNQAVYFLEMGLAGVEEMASGILEKLREIDAERNELIKQYRAIEDEAYHDDVKWQEYVKLSKEINLMDFLPKNNVFEFFVEHNVKGEPLETWLNQIAPLLKDHIGRFDQFISWKEAGFDSDVPDDDEPIGHIHEMKPISNLYFVSMNTDSEMIFQF